VSLLLDALRRAAASKQGPEAEQYVAPRREDETLEPDPDVVLTPPDGTGADEGPDRDGESAAGGRAEGQRGASAGERVPGDADFELSLEPETDDGPASGAPDHDDGGGGARREQGSAGKWAGPARSAQAARPAAATLLKARGGGRSRGHGIVVGIGLCLVIAAALGGGGWWYYTESRQAVAQGLAAYEPTAEPLVDLSNEELGADAASGDSAGGGADADSHIGGAEATDAEAAADSPSESAGSGEATGPNDEPPAEGMAATGRAREQAEASQAAEVAESAAAADNEGLAGGSEPVAQAEPEPETAGTQASATGESEPTPREAQPMVKASGPSMLERALEAGYDALRTGDLAAAEREYRRALRRDDDNRDALLGLASVAERRGDAERAASHYRRILANEPRDPHARAGLASLAGRLDPRRSETELKQLLRDYPDSPLLNFALGNVYAVESRWGEAQQLYFRAYRAEPDNPEYAYNLAVALDHLQQRQAALEHYRNALARLDGVGAVFSVEAVRRRIRQLE